jgi:hypothetical protein
VRRDQLVTPGTRPSNVGMLATGSGLVVR